MVALGAPACPAVPDQWLWEAWVCGEASLSTSTNWKVKLGSQEKMNSGYFESNEI